MNVKQEPLDLCESVCETKLDIISQQTLSSKQKCNEQVSRVGAELLEELNTNIQGLGQNVDENKQIFIKCEEHKIKQSSVLPLKNNHDSETENKLLFNPTTIKKEFDEPSEVTDTDIDDIQEDKAELLTIHDIRSLKNENIEHPEFLADSYDGAQDEELLNSLESNANVLTSRKRRRHLSPKYIPAGTSRTNHLEGYTNETTFHCNHCFKEFDQKSKLRQHLVMHSNENLKCYVCNKEFKHKSNLQRHLIIHTNKKPYKCDICNSEFNQKSSLNTHLMTHTNDKPFKCDICSKTFIQKISLKQHLITHTNEKSFKCNICFKEFNDKSNLRRHSIVHTNEKPFKCSICPKEFKYKNSIQAHLIAHANSGTVILRD